MTPGVGSPQAEPRPRTRRHWPIRFSSPPGALRQYLEVLAMLVLRDRVRIEASSKCQLRCPICPTATGVNRHGSVGWGNLSIDALRQFVDAHPGIRKIELSNWGEIFLNPELKEIIEYAHQMGVKLTGDNGVNFNVVNDEVLEALVRHKFASLTISIDGASNETYQVYRKGGDLDRVIGNIERLNTFKEKYGSRLPRLIWQFVIFGHNEHELPLARALAKQLGMSFRSKLSADHWDRSYAPVRDADFVRTQSGLGVASREEFRERYGRDYKLPCQQLWLSPQINWDGKLLGCCENIWGDYGNVFESGLNSCIRSERYVYTKKMLLGQAEPRSDLPCFNCSFYRNRSLLRFFNANRAKRLLRFVFQAHVLRGNTALDSIVDIARSAQLSKDLVRFVRELPVALIHAA